MSQLVIGVGFRDEASAQSIGEVLAGVAARSATCGVATVLAVLEEKAAHPGLRAAAQATQLRIETVTADAMGVADARITTRSEQVKKHRGVGSVCEATALAAAGVGARLLVTRVVSSDRQATAAAAIIEDSAS
ncbi:cobalamin biosynthesis protein [Bradyrhizobium canariense]|uniref:Cobalt-precorrin 5A hydrolase n=1 Tax=Bradyrhizobium canariense TaxID=255045 RepID=A0A1H1X8G7_9BRAD|nr:cobalamin biosynthesis protein [Bradyrhizobium canariense]SDT05588.1 cobalt-precorrin 5A hydrolase [Bradyrhizobium canariense]